MSNDYKYHSIVPSSGAFGSTWPQSGTIPQSYSSAGWTIGDEGFVQQTFLGASIRNFSVEGGFGDTSSNISVSLVDDEFNMADQTCLGEGDDVYHSGIADSFNPPPVGSPVFFKFGKNHATIEQAWRKTFDDIYEWETIDPRNLRNLDPKRVQSGLILPNRSKRREYESLKELKNNPFEPNTEREYVDVSGSDIPNREYLIVDRKEELEEDYIGRGSGHFVFGGILQSYTENYSPDGRVYSVVAVDPREILANTTLILNNYADSVLKCPNLINVYGLLEYNPTTKLKDRMDAYYHDPTRLYGTASGILDKIINLDGSVTYRGGVDPVTNDDMPQYTDCYAKTDYFDVILERFGLNERNPILNRILDEDVLPNAFPYTGTSYSRRSEKGLPFYRILQSINCIMEYEGRMPKEYKKKNFGGEINFRGFRYIVDLSGLPTDKIPPMYNFDFDQMSILEFCQEICDIISHDLYVSLLPVIDHPACQVYYEKNQKIIEDMVDSENIKPEELDGFITGIIRIDAIDRSKKPSYGSILRYMENLEKHKINVTQKNVGYELSNVPTDKFVVGAQEVEMYYFSTNEDRDHLETRKLLEGVDNRYNYEQEQQWSITNSLKQQVLPFYGFLGKDTLSIPRGYGSFQQIMLDTTSLAANGVGNYYIATEIELRAAAISYEAWKQFLVQYNDTYLESVEENDTVEGHILQTLEISEIDNNYKPAVPSDISNNYAVTVPRCVFRSDRDYVDDDNLPASPCSPPFGYPLYYKRAMKIGISEAGLAAFSVTKNRIITNIAKFKNIDGKNWRKLLNSSLQEVLNPRRPGISEEERNFILEIQREIANASNNSEEVIGLIERKFLEANGVKENLPRLAKKNEENAMKVYQFLKKIADENLGKKFLVKIPKETNYFYSKVIDLNPLWGSNINGIGERINNIRFGPFGFTPRQISNDISYLRLPGGLDIESPDSDRLRFHQELHQARTFVDGLQLGYFKHYLDIGIENGISKQISDWLDLGTGEVFDRKFGALKVGYNVLNERHEFNYSPEPQGGFFEYDLFNDYLTQENLDNIPDTNKWPLGTQQAMFPRDLSNIVNENGRISCYVRYDNSQFLSMKGIPEDYISQQVVDAEGRIIPDVTYQLENMGEDNLSDFPNTEYRDPTPVPKSVAFVKCSVDERFYLAPKHEINLPTFVFGRKVKNINKLTPPKRIWSEKRNEFVESYPVYQANYIPDSGGGLDGKIVMQEDFLRYWDENFQGNLVDTYTKNQDLNHVYALITLPGKIVPTVDSRMRDGPFQLHANTTMKHFLTIDVVKNVEGFDVPAARGKPTDFLCENINEKGFSDEFYITNDSIANAFSAYNAAMKALSFNALSKIGMLSPSPVFPDMVAVPLLSKERCYGPWLSSELSDTNKRLTEIPGKVDFIKDENLCPWNYGGYKVLNDVGRLRSEFSNSVSLFSEKGSVSYEGMPSGNTLCKALIDGGPLVTNISVSVDGGGGINTSYTMNVYTPRFGKMHKQKEQLISQISREKQKVLDERNAMIRKGMGKAQKSVNYSILNDSFQSLKGISEVTNSWQDRLDKGENIASKKVATIETRKEKVVIDGEKEEIETKEIVETDVHEEAIPLSENKSPNDAQRRSNKQKIAFSEPTIPISTTPAHTDIPTIEPIFNDFYDEGEFA